MADATWSSLGTASGNIASTTLNSLANGSESSVVTYDNSTNKNLYALVKVKLGSITSTTGASITLRVAVNDGTDSDDAGTAGDLYAHSVTVSTSAKVVIFPMIRIYPFSLRLSVTNNTGVALASSSNSIDVIPYGETIA